MKKMQRFMGVGDSKPASAPLSTSPANSYQASTLSSNQYAPPSNPAAMSPSYDNAAANLLLPPSQTAQPQQPSLQPQYGSRHVSPQSSHTLLHSARASPQPYTPSAQLHYFDLPTRAVSPDVALSPRPISPLAQPLATPLASTSALKPVSSVDVNLVERPDLHKSLKALESLLVNLDEYRDLSARLAKVEKKLAKSASELERTKVVQDTPAQTLQITSTMFEALAEVSSRHAKHVQKEYEAVNDACAKYFNKVAKEERAHDQLVHNLDAKIKKANAAHEKNVKKATTNKALESHDKYIATVQALTNDISRAKNAHALSMAAKSHVSSLLVASTLGGLADVEFKRRCESVRRVGPHVGRLNELLCFTSSEYMPALQASEFDQAQQGHAEYLASLAAQVEAQVVAQAQINAKINEDTQTILRAQEMGWRPPSPLAPPTTGYANLGRSSSINSNASRATDAAGSNRPPLQSATSNSNLAGSRSSSNNLAAAAAAAAAAATTTTNAVSSSASLQQPQRDSARSRSNSSSRVEPPSTAAASISTPIAADSDAASIHSVATDKTPRPATNSASQPPTSALASNALLGAPNADSLGVGSVRLDRALTGSTMKSMAAQPQTWEDATNSSSSSAVGAPTAWSGDASSRVSNAPSTHDRDRTDSSTQEGSVFDKLAVPREGSDAVPPSLSASNSAQGSEDGNRIPRTPDDSESLPTMQANRNASANAEPQQLSSKDVGILDYRNLQAPSSVAELDRQKAGASPNMRPAQRALEQYREQTAKAATSPTATRFDRDTPAANAASGLDRSDSVYSATSQQSGTADQADANANARKISLWERERERMRQLEREEDLSRTPVSATTELNYSRPPSGLYSGSTGSSYTNNGGWSRSKMSETSNSDKSAGSQLGLGYPRPAGGDGNDLDRYAPAVGSTRLSASGVTRSLSTDTTASERSFVARMKARYQAEKDLEREQRELNVLEKERAARRATMDPNFSLPSLGGVRGGRVPEIASRYQMSGAATYAQEVNSGRRYHDSLPAGVHSNGNSRISAISSAPSAASGNGGIDEFGGIVRDSRLTGTLPAGGPRAMEPPHSDVCGCHQCSARHYGNGTTKVDNTARSTGRGDPREFNVRRTSMPVAPRESTMQQQYIKHHQQQPAYASSPPRASPHDSYSQQAYAYRQQQQQQQQQQQHLHAPGGRDIATPRRSYDDVGSGSDAGSRRVVFAHEPQTIR
ncbi:uncharacterized protein UTRI_06462 [Ustilago trichophora]|uniref:Uncharacterized protein n=1 Tax=Ustilago trichophora TaxID=86804 RepID=A0A5C3EJB0_9BASI|nr:uncharacterized protein UTRI_06462 [Ustilago trichophora]